MSFLLRFILVEDEKLHNEKTKSALIIMVIVFIIVIFAVKFRANVQKRKYFWSIVDRDLTYMNNYILDVLAYPENIENFVWLEEIMLLNEDTGTIMNYNSQNLFDWYEEKEVCG